jgi:hypothetical protein
VADFDSALNNFFGKFTTAVQQYVPNMIAETAVEHYKNALISKSWNGTAYPAYGNAAKEPRRGSLMMRSMALFNSIKPKTVTAQKVVISAGNSRVKYARAHNEGLKIIATANIGQYTNRNFMGKGKSVGIKAHRRKINFTMPKRQFMGKNPLLLGEIKTRFHNTFKDHLK